MSFSLIYSVKNKFKLYPEWVYRYDSCHFYNKSINNYILDDFKFPVIRMREKRERNYILLDLDIFQPSLENLSKSAILAKFAILTKSIS